MPTTCHTAVAAFWTNFVPPVHTNAPSSDQVEPAGIEPAIGIESHSEGEFGVFPDNLKEALAAAKAEIQAASDEGLTTPSPVVAKPVGPQSRAKGKEIAKETLQDLMEADGLQVAGVVKIKDEIDPLRAAAKTRPPITTDQSRSVSMDLDPGLAAKLRTLRRLNPNKSDIELLTILGASPTTPAKPKAKKGWFSR